MSPKKLTTEEKQLRQYEQHRREILIANARAEVVKKQIVDAYTILEGIRFDYVSDTAFRDKITEAKKGLESALSDFLLSSVWHDDRRRKHNKLSPLEFANRKEEAEKQIGVPVKGLV